MDTDKFTYFLAAVTVMFLALLQACWFIVKTLLSCVFYFVAFFTFGLLIGGVVGHTHEHY